MKYYKYGKFDPSDYKGSWVGIAVLMSFSFLSIWMELNFIFVIFPLVCATVWICVVLIPHFEKFEICDKSIEVLLANKKRSIPLPTELTLVVSYADICPPLAVHTAIENQTHILKNKFAVSLLQAVSSDDVLKALHQSYIQKCTTSQIKSVFEGSHYIYSFVCEQELIDKLSNNRNCKIIIPKSLFSQINFNLDKLDISIDENC